MHILDRPDRFPRSSRYDPDWLLGLDMGPHPLWQLEDLLPDLRLRPDDRVLDLGCGRGATAVFLAREASVVVSAFDRWVDEADLRAVVDTAGLADRITVAVGDVRHLPFADAEFDAIVSVDAFEYFGTDVHLLPTLLRVLKPGGRIAISTPALKIDPYLQPPPEQVTALAGWEAAAWHAPDWWRRHWQLTGLVEDVTARMQPGSRNDWMLWARATGAGDSDPLLSMLTSVEPDDIGFALVSAVKSRCARDKPSLLILSDPEDEVALRARTDTGVDDVSVSLLVDWIEALPQHSRGPLGGPASARTAATRWELKSA